MESFSTLPWKSTSFWVTWHNLFFEPMGIKVVYNSFLVLQDEIQCKDEMKHDVFDYVKNVIQVAEFYKKKVKMQAFQF